MTFLEPLKNRKPETGGLASGLKYLGDYLIYIVMQE